MADDAVSTGRLARRGARVVVVSASVGAGHVVAARAWAQRLEKAGFSVVHRDFLDALPSRIGHSMSRDYLGVLGRWPWLYGALFALCTRRAPAAVINRVLLGTLRRRLGRMVDPEAVAVLSTYPLASQVLGQLRASGALEVPVITFLTDFSVHHLWVSPQVDVHLALHSNTAEAARRLGARHAQVTGPVVPSGLSVVAPPDRCRARLAFGLPLEGCLALLVGGSWAVGEIEAAARDVAATGRAVPVVACGHNTLLRQRLQSLGVGVALGWVTDMPQLLRAVDVVVENAGGMTSLEAMAAGTPLITYRPIPGHGRANARALHDAGVSSWARDEDELARRLGELADGSLGERQRATARAMFDHDPMAWFAQVLRPDSPGAQTSPLVEQSSPRRRWRRVGLAAGAVAALVLGHSLVLTTVAELLR